MRNYPSIGLQAADILLPRPGIDLHKWAVIACDQFTSEPEYWQKVAALVQDSPSTYHLTLPEVFLGTAEEDRRIQSTQLTMQKYLAEGIFREFEGLIYVERTVGGKTRRGLMAALDLEQYDFSKGSTSLIRATEGTILDRLPPRIRIREHATIEFPHILVLIDDPERTVIEPLAQAKAGMERLYDFDLMAGSGHLSGYAVNSLEEERRIVRALENLATPEMMANKYQSRKDAGILLYAVGDGNHSLATAKSIWEKMKHQVGPDHPARFALVEIENIHDEGLVFEPIHRVLFHVASDPAAAPKKAFGRRLTISACQDQTEMIRMVESQTGGSHRVGMVAPDGVFVLTIEQPEYNLPVGTLQKFLDEWLKENPEMKIDYVHGSEVLCRLGTANQNLGFYLPAMPKGDLFKTVLLDGALPRKTFSMGEAHEKRFYLEGRKIQ